MKWRGGLSAPSALSKPARPKLSTTTILSASSTTPQVGTAVTLTAAVSGSGPSGSVAFKDGATTLATVALSNGVASYVSPALAPGVHSITAAYAGDGNFNGSASPNGPHDVNLANTSTSVTGSSSNPSVHGQNVTWTNGKPKN